MRPHQKETSTSMGTITSGPVRYCAWFVIAAFVLACVLVACSDGDQKPAVVEPGRGFTALSAGAYHTCAITTDARVMCWGANRDGQLGIKPSGDLEQRAYLVEGLGT
jgi:Regulator of chromosome condensation (RCC1) repeat